MEKIKIVHIHTDIKFINGINRFYGEAFENKTIIIGNRDQYKGPYESDVKYYDYSLNDYNQIIEQCQESSIVVLHNLDFVKSFIANRIPASVMVLWRFFGLELYEKMPNYVYSEKTKEILAQEKKKRNISLDLKREFMSFLSMLKYRGTPENEINKAAFKRADFFLGLSKSEYDFLKIKWPDLPPFLQLDLSTVKSKDVKKNKSNLIVLGNNKNAYNNHLDIIDGIKNIKINHDFKFLLLFNYGVDNNYSQAVIKEARQVNSIRIIEDFLPLKKFIELYSNADALVMNGYRQMAMDNIFEALKNGTKVYLNEKNVILEWLRKEGFKVYTMDDFFTDLTIDNIALSPDDSIFNGEQLVKFTTKYNRPSFQQKLIDLVKREVLPLS